MSGYPRHQSTDRDVARQRTTPDETCQLQNGRMHDPRIDDTARGTHAADIGSLASAALSRLVAQRSGGAPAGHRAAHMRDIFEASIEPGGDRLRELVRELLHLGVCQETIVDIYIPEVARRLGGAWLADRLSFVEVSIGSARLQAMARELTEIPPSNRHARARVAVVVPRSEDHTLGAVVLTGQLRRLGLSVTLHMRDACGVVADALRIQPTDAVMVSASHVERLGEVAEIVAAVRSTLGRELPVAVGGPILQEHDLDLLVETGADHAAVDAVDAIALCRLGERTSPDAGRTGRHDAPPRRAEKPPLGREATK